MEAAIYGMRLGLESLKKLGMSAGQITLTGGGSQSRAWRQMAADITGLPVQIPDTHDSAAMGAALQALWFYLQEDQNGAAPTIEELTEEHLGQTGPTVEPGKNAALYDEGYARYSEYLEALKALYT